LSRPEHLHDFDVDFALFNLRKRRATLGGLVGIAGNPSAELIREMRNLI